MRCHFQSLGLKRPNKTRLLKDNDAMLLVTEASTLDTLLIFTSKGNYVFLPVFKLPTYKWKELGTHINNIVQLEEDESIVRAFTVSSFDIDAHLLFVTKNNYIKLTALKDFEVSRYTKPIRALSLQSGDKVVSVDWCASLESEILLLSKRGEALRFGAKDIPVTSTTAKGVKGMNLAPKNELAVGMVLKDHHDLLILTNRGTIKRVDLTTIQRKKRAQRGLQQYKIIRSNPYLVQDAALMNATQYKHRATLTIITTKGAKQLTAFDIKFEKSDAGKKFLTKSDGDPLFILIESLVEDETLAPISEYVKEEEREIVQPTLFDEEAV